MRAWITSVGETITHAVSEAEQNISWLQFPPSDLRGTTSTGESQDCLLALSGLVESQQELKMNIVKGCSMNTHFIPLGFILSLFIPSSPSQFQVWGQDLHSISHLTQYRDIKLGIICILIIFTPYQWMISAKKLKSWREAWVQGHHILEYSLRFLSTTPV